MIGRRSGSSMAAQIAVSFLLVFGLCAQPSANAQNPPSRTAAKQNKWVSPRMPDGHPDLQGVWGYAMITPLERPPELANKPFLTEQEAAAYEREVRNRTDVDTRNRKGTDEDVSLAYNDSWYDRGTKVDKARRTSLIFDPPDGRIPALTPAAQARAAVRAEYRRQHPADGPEDRALNERCLVMGNMGPPMIPGPYNNNFQIFQTPEKIVLLTEMLHTSRVIPLDGRPHLPSGVRQWLGDSVGHWEGDTLVVETTNFTDRTAFRGSGPNMRLVERFTRTADRTLQYEFTVQDPESFTKPWSAGFSATKSDGPMYEYACHEGNYGMTGLLSAARAEEKKAAERLRQGGPKQP